MDLKNRDFLKEIDFTSDEFLYLIDLAIELKAEKKQRREVQRMVGRNIALILKSPPRELVVHLKLRHLIKVHTQLI